MQRETELPQPGRVVHVVGRVTDEVFSFLGPATHALARSGREQTVVMIDEPRHRRHVAGLHDSAELMLTPPMRSPFRQWQAMHRACDHAMRAGPLHAVHLHGLLAGLLGANALRSIGVEVPLFFSPHDSRSVSAWRALGRLPFVVTRPWLRDARHAAIVNLPKETHAFADWKATELVESPVGEAFFSLQRSESRHPLIVTGGRMHGVRSPEKLAQLAVLLGGEDLRISFNWLGSVDDISRTRLNAAGVGVFELADANEYAARLSPGWIYVAPGGTRGFPLFLVEAMAAGLPCVALDNLQHRDVIRHGETGFLCTSERQMMECIATLVDNAELRHRIGQAARAAARRRFSEDDFNKKLLAAYALPT